MNNPSLLTTAALTGADDSFIDHFSLERPVHVDLIAPWQELRAAAFAAGFDLAIASGYRSYQRQLQIWNGKAAGSRPVLDEMEAPLDIDALDDWRKVQAILRWSALPGASRHHWGTDIDVFDRAAVAADYQVQLSAAEASDGGPFGALHRWLDERIAAGAFGFFRPYAVDRGGVAPERWHLSYAPLALHYQNQLRADRLRAVLDTPELALRETVVQHWPLIFARYVQVPARVYPERFQSQLSDAVQ